MHGVLVFSINRTNRRCRHMYKRMIIKYWLMQSQKLKSPTVSHLQARDQGKLVIYFKGRPTNQRAEGADSR